MTLDNQQGDVLLAQTPNDGEIIAEGGIVTMTGGLETSAYLALFGGNEDDTGLDDDPAQWWGNFLETGTARTYRSRTQNLLQSLPFSVANLGRLEDAALEDLAFFTSERIASSVTVTASIPAFNRLHLTITIVAEGIETQFEFTENWKAGGVSGISTMPTLIIPPEPPGPVITPVNTASLNGSNQNFWVAPYQPSTQLSVSIRVKMKSAVGSFIVGQWHGGTATDRSFLIYYTGAKFDFYVSPQLTFSAIAPSYSTTVDQWYTLTLTHDGTAFKAYVDGVEKGSVAVSDPYLGSSSRMGIGRQYNGSSGAGNYANMDVAFLRMWSRGLTPSEVTEISDANAICPDSLSVGIKNGMVRNYQLANGGDLAVGQELVDQIGLGNDLDNVGSTPFTGTGLDVEC